MRGSRCARGGRAGWRSIVMSSERSHLTHIETLLAAACASRCRLEIGDLEPDCVIVVPIDDVDGVIIAVTPPGRVDAVEGATVRCEVPIEACWCSFDATVVAVPSEETDGRLLLECGGEVVIEQRRRHYRVSMVGAQPIPVQLRRLHPAGAGSSAAVVSPLFEGTLVNLSIGGVAIRVEAGPGSDIEVGDRLPLRFVLPDEIEPFAFLGVVRQVRVVDGRAKRLGVTFEPWPSERHHALGQERLQRYIAAIQRRRLRHAE